MPRQLIKVRGKEGAMSLELEPYSTILALDITAPLVWLIRVSGSGERLCLAYEITPRYDINYDE